jgi:hypothetical protein
MRMDGWTKRFPSQEPFQMERDNNHTFSSPSLYTETDAAPIAVAAPRAAAPLLYLLLLLLLLLLPAAGCTTVCSIARETLSLFFSIHAR